MASLNFRAIRGATKMFGTTFSEPWTERLQTQPQLSSSSSAAAEEFPARVLQQIVSHHLRCLGKYPSTAGGSKGNTHQLSVGPSLWLHPFLSLSLIYFLWTRFFFFFSDEKKRSTTVQNIQETVWQFSLLLMIWKLLVILSHHKYSTPVLIWAMQIQCVWFQIWSFQRTHANNVNLVTTRQSRVWLLLYCKIHTNAWCSISYTQTQTVHDFTYTFTSLWGAIVLCAWL